MSRVDIGLVYKCESWEVESRLFPSKIGGFPAWLDLNNLLDVEDLLCGTCNLPMTFLCQVYAPSKGDDNFHRTIFVFVCRNSTCCHRNNSDNMKVFRSSLGRANKFYSFDPPRHEPDLNFSLAKWVKLCVVCGCKGLKHCGKCKEAFYCCRSHQVYDWKRFHKDNCGKQISPSPSEILFPEYEIDIASKGIQHEEVDDEKEMLEFERLASEGKAGSLAEVSESELESLALVDTDKVFMKFRKCVSSDPEQVLRYDRGGEPLWIAAGPKPDHIPNCEYCGGRRQFEFQIMPQMLTVLKEECIDWGVLAVYTCEASCVIDDRYKKEFVFKQDVSVD